MVWQSRCEAPGGTSCADAVLAAQISGPHANTANRLMRAMLITIALDQVARGYVEEDQPFLQRFTVFKVQHQCVAVPWRPRIR